VQTPSGGRPWLVAGTRISAGNSTATVWTSPHGARWSPQPLTSPGIDSHADAVTAWGSRTVVVGSTGPADNQTAAVWINRAPGSPFVQVPAADLPAPPGYMSAVAGGALGLFAAGQAAGRVAIWYSSNGTRWTRLTAAERVVNGATDPHISSLTVASDGVFAAGWQQDGSHTDAAVWTSTDGVHWHPVLTAQAAFAGGGDRIITDLVAVGTGTVPFGFVAVGGVRLGTGWQPASWISPNGVSWSEPSRAFTAPPRPQGSAGDAIVRSMSIATNGPQSATLVAAGGSATAQRVWRSADGIHWSEIPLPTGPSDSSEWTASLVSSNGTSLAVASGTAGEPHVLIDPGTGWTEPSAQASVFGGVQTQVTPVSVARGPAGLVLAVNIVHSPQALGPARAADTSLEFLSSADGATWRSAPAGPVFAGATVSAIAPLGRRYIAVGSRTIGSQPRAVAWASANGIDWGPASLLDTPSPAHGPAVESNAAGECARGGVLAAVGAVAERGVTAPRAWTSSDGVHWTAARVTTAPRPPKWSRMLGCVTVGSAFEAYGTVRQAGPSGTYGPLSDAVWTKSATSTAWVPQDSDAFDRLPGPVTDLANWSRSWLGLVAGDSVLAGQAGSSSSLYVSTDNAAGWQPLDTSVDPWAGATPAQIDEVTWWGATPVVVGQVDGELAVWTGAPTS
jgi:hypothetical protein